MQRSVAIERLINMTGTNDITLHVITRHAAASAHNCTLIAFLHSFNLQSITPRDLSSHQPVSTLSETMEDFNIPSQERAMEDFNIPSPERVVFLERLQEAMCFMVTINTRFSSIGLFNWSSGHLIDQFYLFRSQLSNWSISMGIVSLRSGCNLK